MQRIDAALEKCHDATNRLIAAGESAGTAWRTASAPGKWSPSQIVEHVAMSLEESAKGAAGQPTKFPKMPAIIHPLIRTVFFKRVLKKERFPKAKTNAAMNPVVGPTTPLEGRKRLEAAQRSFDAACRQLVLRGERIKTTIFGTVSVEDYVRFMELHTRHHCKQMPHS